MEDNKKEQEQELTSFDIFKLQMKLKDDMIKTMGIDNEDKFSELCDKIVEEPISFLEFFKKVSMVYYNFFEYKYKRSFLNFLDNDMLEFKYGNSVMSDLKMLYLIMIKHDYREKENRIKNYKNELCVSKTVKENFNILFPEYIFVKDEYVVKNIGRVDILAKDKVSGRDVIIEIKKGKENPNKQLLAYSKEFTNPILIGITNMDKKYYLENIRYIKVSDIIDG